MEHALRFCVSVALVTKPKITTLFSIASVLVNGPTRGRGYQVYPAFDDKYFEMTSMYI